MPAAAAQGEQVLWQPSAQRKRAANLTAFIDRYLPAAGYPRLHQWSIAEPERFWTAVWEFCRIDGERREPVYRQSAGLDSAVFFPEATLNYAANLLRGPDARLALVAVAEDGARRELTMGQVRAQVSVLQQAMRAAGVGRGDCVAAVAPNCPEAVLVMLAAQALGATFTSCSPDFGAAALLDRLGQLAPKLVFACSAYRYRGKVIELAPRLAELAGGLAAACRWVVFGYAGVAPALPAHGWERFVRGYAPRAVEFAPVRGADPGFYLFSSGTTGKPKSIVHSAGGMLLKHLCELSLHLDVKPGDRMFFFTTCGWMMWNWQVSALAAGAAVVLYDGHPMHPEPERLAQLAIDEQVTHFGASAKYFAACAKSAVRPRRMAGGDFLRCVMSTGSPLLHESFDYLYQEWGRDLHVASISGGTDICSCFVGGVPVLPVRRGQIQAAELGCDVAAYDADGRAVQDCSGELVCRNAIPSMPLGLVGDPDGDRFRQTYFARFAGVWSHGDWVRFTEHGSLVISGRSDAVLNPGGVRIGTAELYRAVEALDEVAEAVAVGQDVGGDQRIVLFVQLRAGEALGAPLRKLICARIKTRCSPRHVPAKVIAVADIPRTRSGKIAELAVAAAVNNRAVANTGALANPEALKLYRGLPELAT